MASRQDLLRRIKETLAGKGQDVHGGGEPDLNYTLELLVEYMEKMDQFIILHSKYCRLCADVQRASMARHVLKGTEKGASWESELAEAVVERDKVLVELTEL